VSPELSQLVELQELDFEVQRVAERLGSIPLEREQIEDTFNQYAAEFLTLKSEYEQAINDRQQLELELADTQQSNDKYKQDLMRVRNEKEYTTVLREIDATKKHISLLETEVLKRMETIEKLEKDLSVYSPEIELKRQEVDRDLATLDQEHRDTEQRLAGFTERRKTLAANIPQNLLAVYERIARLRRGQALAEVRDATCSACKMRLRPKVFSDVRKGDQLIACDNCSRIFFYRPQSSESAEAAIS
jgi:predicted  nucleic acid-binding Zn-ribbon protein